MIQKEQTNLIGLMEHCQLVLYIQERGFSSNEESQSQEKHGMRRHVYRPNTNHRRLSSRVNLKRNMTINKWHSKCNHNSVATKYTVHETLLRESWWMQARNAVMGKIHEALADGTLHADEVKVLEEMSETLKESFEVRLKSVLQPQFDGQCAVDDAVQSLHHFSRNKTLEISAQNRCQSAEELNRKGAAGPRPAVHSCEEDPFQSGWKESSQTKLTNKTLIMKSSSIIDQHSASGDDELNDESEDDADVINGNRVTR